MEFRFLSSQPDGIKWAFSKDKRRQKEQADLRGVWRGFVPCESFRSGRGVASQEIATGIASLNFFHIFPCLLPSPIHHCGIPSRLYLGFAPNPTRIFPPLPGLLALRLFLLFPFSCRICWIFFLFYISAFIGKVFFWFIPQFSPTLLPPTPNLALRSFTLKSGCLPLC